MNKVVTVIDKISTFLTLFVVSCILLISSFVLTIAPQAAAKSLTPEANSYEMGDRPSEDITGYYRLNSTRSPQAEGKIQQALPRQSDVDELEGNYAEENQFARNAQEDLQDNVRSGARSGARSGVDNVREKLNLDQPMYSGTKEFIEDVQEKAGNVIDNTKNAFTGVAEDARDTVRDSYKRVDN